MFGVDQEGQEVVFCQNGEENVAVNWNPEFAFIELGGDAA